MALRKVRRDTICLSLAKDTSDCIAKVLVFSIDLLQNFRVDHTDSICINTNFVNNQMADNIK
jgi:hypothetical protein